MSELAAIRRSSTTHPSNSVAMLEQPGWSRKVSAASMYIPAMAPEILGEHLFPPVWSRHARLDRYLRN